MKNPEEGREGKANVNELLKNMLEVVGIMPVEKVIEIVGISTISWQDAAQNALVEAVKTLRNIRELRIEKFTAKVKENKIEEYRADVKVVFLVERVPE